MIVDDRGLGGRLAIGWCCGEAAAGATKMNLARRWWRCSPQALKSQVRSSSIFAMACCGRRCIAMLGGFASKKISATALASNGEKGAKKISMLSGLIRRNSATLAPLVGEEKDNMKETMKEGGLKSKSLYLCFEEKVHPCGSAHVIKNIQLSELLAAPSDGYDDAELKLGEVAYRHGPDTNVPFMMSTSLIGSKIIFSGGVVMNRKEYFPNFVSSKEVCEFETDPSKDANPKLQPSEVYKTSRPLPFLEEVAGQVYCIGGPSYSKSFEVFDRTQEKWLPLDVPPGKYPRQAIVCHATVGNKMLLWVKNKTGVLGFDVTRPERGWSELDSSLGSCMPYVVDGVKGNTPLFVKLKSGGGDGDGDGFLLFSCDLKQPLTVRVFHVSHECDSMKPMDPLPLPKLPRTFPVPQQCKFFRLEDKKIGLVLYHDRREFRFHNYDSYDDDDDDDDDDYSRERIHVIIFEVEIAEKSMDVKYKLLTTRCLEYSTRNPPKGVEKFSSILKGAHVI